MQNLTTSQAKRISVAVDAMGGDQAPEAVIVGAVAAARMNSDIEIILVGDTAVVEPCLAAQGERPANISLRHASQVVDMCEAPGVAIRQKRDSSITVGMYLVRDGLAQAVISAGNSGAMMAGAMLILKAQPGIDRPAIATLLPTKKGRIVLLDSGATTDCKPANLVQFAHLGTTYAASAFNKPSPCVGLLSIGEEPSKGDELTKETHQLLQDTAGINFVGNVEPKEIMRGDIDVVVCDGFVGNLMLKAFEGIAEMLFSLIKEEIGKGFFSSLGALLLRPVFGRIKRRFDYAEVGGALLLGVNGVVVISHGRSNAHAIKNAILVAARAAQYQVGDGTQSKSHEHEFMNAVSPQTSPS